MIRKLVLFLAISSLFCAVTLGSGREESIAAMRIRLGDFGRLELECDGRVGEELPRELAQSYDRAWVALQNAPLDILLPAVDACIRGGTRDEMVGAEAIYLVIVEQRKTKADPAYHPILLDRLAKDDLRSRGYTLALVGLLREYPSRETVMATMALAERAPTRAIKVEYVRNTASMVGIWLDIYTNSPEAQVDRELARFEAWFEKHRDRIEFDKKGKLHLSHGKVAGREQAGLGPEDRARIRGNAACVLQLLSLTLGDAADEEESNAKAPALNAKCGAALFGTERSALMGRMGEAAAGGGSPPMEMQAELQGAADYPTADAALLAAIYAVSQEEDSAVLGLARETLARTSRAEIRRVAKGEPASVRKKAEALAGKD